MKSLAVILGSGVFCDWFTVTVPALHAMTLFDGFIEAMGVRCDERDGKVAVGSHGLLKYGAKHGVGWLSVSGDAVATLRDAGTLQAVLSVVAGMPHRVSRLDASLDVAQDTPAALAELYRRGKRGGISLTRKAVRGVDMRCMLGAGSAGGADTGTVYTGKRGSTRVLLRAYDKLQHAISMGYSLPAVYFDQVGVTRYELELSRHVGCTLRDVWEPSGVFWHHMATVLPRLAPVPLVPWTANGEGFDVIKTEPDYWKMLDAYLLSGGVRRLGRIARGLGPNGVDQVMAAVRDEVERIASGEPLGKNSKLARSA